jgi:nitroreductase
LRAYPELVGEHLGIPDDEQILCGLSFGYEDPTVPANQTRQPRDPISSNVVFRGDVG